MLSVHAALPPAKSKREARAAFFYGRTPKHSRMLAKAAGESTFQPWSSKSNILKISSTGLWATSDWWQKAHTQPQQSSIKIWLVNMRETTNRNKNHLQNLIWIVKFSNFWQGQWKLNWPWSDITLRAEALKLPISALRVIDFARQRAETLQNGCQGGRRTNFSIKIFKI